MAYGKPICTFIRSEETKQCVEYSYIENNTNGLIFTNIDDCITRISQLTNDEIKQLGANAKKGSTIINSSKHGSKCFKYSLNN